MEVAREELEDNKVELKVEIEPERVNKALDQAYNKVVKDVEIPGFRKGKVPRKILEAKYGEEVLHKDALDILIPRAYQEAVKAAEIEPVDQPDIDDFYIAKDEPATFTAVVEVKPEVELGEYTGQSVEKDEVEVTEEEIDQQLDRLQEQYSQLVATDKEKVEEGDFVIIDYEGTIDGETFPGGSNEEYSLEIGSGTFIPGFEEKLIGHQVGEEFKIDIMFPEDYQAEDLAGQEATFNVNIKEIKEKNVPELNDDFAKEASEHDTLEELKSNIKEEMQTQKERQVEQDYENSLIEAVADNAEVSISDTLIKNELDKMFQNLKMSISQQGLDVDSYLEYMGMDESSWREQNRNTAEARAKNNLVLEEIAEKEGIEVSEEEIDDKVAEIAAENDQDPEQVKQFLQMQGQLSGLVSSMEMEKTIEFLAENNETTEKNKETEEN